MRTLSSSSMTAEDAKLDSPTRQRLKSPTGKWFSWNGKLPKLRRNPATRDCPPEPLKEELTFEQHLERLDLSEACRQLIGREERLFGRSGEEEEEEEEEALGRRKEAEEEERRQLAEDRAALLRLAERTFRETLESEEVNAEVLRSAVDALRQDARQDARWEEEEEERVQAAPAWRPSRWGRVHHAALRSAVEERMGSVSTPAGGQGDQSPVQNEVCAMARLLKEDLLRVVDVVKGCYPAEMDVCNLYADMYHQAFSARLRRIAGIGVGDKDCVCLLRWTNEYYPDILKKRELAEINSESLGKLLPEALSICLEKQYLTNTQGEVKDGIKWILNEAEQTWTDGAEAELSDGCYCSHLAVDVVQLIDGKVRSAVIILGDQHKAMSIMCLLEDFLQSFMIFQDGVVKGGKANSRSIMMANLVCVEQFRDYIVKKADFFPEDVMERCLSVLSDMKQSGNSHLLSALHKKLKPQYSHLGTSDWLNKKLLFMELCDSIEGHMQDLRGLSDACHQGLMSQLHLDVTAEYVKRLLKGKVKLKDKEVQDKAARTVSEDGRRLHCLFVKAGSREAWLSDILPKIAEMLTLQDTASMQMEIVSLGTAYPDLSEKHVSALLKLKTNLSSADRKKVKAALTDFKTTEPGVDAAQAFFSRVKVK